MSILKKGILIWIFIIFFMNMTLSAESFSLCFKISDMTCSSCKNKIIDALTQQQGVKSVDISLKSGLASISLLPDKIDNQVIIELIKKAGYRAESVKCLK